MEEMRFGGSVGLTEGILPTSHNVYKAQAFAPLGASPGISANYLPQQRLYFEPEPHGHCALRETFAGTGAAGDGVR